MYQADIMLVTEKMDFLAAVRRAMLSRMQCMPPESSRYAMRLRHAFLQGLVAAYLHWHLARTAHCS